MQLKCSKGFSLVELMIVLAVVAILAAVAIPAYNNHILRTRQSEAYHNLLDIKAAQEMFYSQYDEYAGPYTPLLTANTFSNLLSFQYSDSTYYAYHIRPSGTGTEFAAMARGKYKKLNNNNIIITDAEDPCICSPGSLKQSLGLADCSPCPAGW